MYPFYAKFDPSKSFFMGCVHINHKNICRGTSTWQEGYRDFDGLEKMNDALINNINKVVKYDDYLFILGDWLFGDKTLAKSLRSRIQCQNLIYIFGNHCDWLRKDESIQKELFTWCGDYLEVFLGKQRVCMSHYPMRSWHDIQRNSWMLHSHTHGSLPDDKSLLSIDCGTDTEWFKEGGELYMTTNYNKSYEFFNGRRLLIDRTPTKDIIHSRFHPYSMDELSTIMNWKKQFRKGVDHHG